MIIPFLVHSPREVGNISFPIITLRKVDFPTFEGPKNGI